MTAPIRGEEVIELLRASPRGRYHYGRKDAERCWVADIVGRC